MDFFSRKRSKVSIDPENVFPDSLNSPGFAKERKEGLIEPLLGDRPFFLLAVFILLGFVFVLFQLWRLGVINSAYFKKMVENNEFDVIYTEPLRGIIYDSKERKLVNNLQTYFIVINKKFFKDTESYYNMLLALGEVVGIEPKKILEDAGLEVSSNRLETFPEQILLQEPIPVEVVLEIQANAERFPGVYVLERFSREYPYGPSLSHVLGYTGMVSDKDLERGYFINDSIGKDGLEYFYESELKGNKGKKIVQVDALGRYLQERRFLEGRSGHSLILNIDAELQKFVYDALSRHVLGGKKMAGSVVVSDVNNGGILALVNYPGFDNNQFGIRGSRKKVENILQDERSLLLNRAVGGSYPSGSSIKPFIAAAALEEKVIDEFRNIYAPGYIEIPNPYKPGERSVFRDWKIFGNVDMKEALAWSSNVYFFTIGGGNGDIRGLGIERIKKYLNLFGFGSVLGIDLPGEVNGLVPDPSWKAKNRTSDPLWRLGDTYNVSIGQGDVLVTPLQINFATAAIANGGKLMKPRILKKIIDDDKSLIKEPDKEILHKNFIGQDSLKVVREGMRRAVTSGSSWALADAAVTVAGKTGTAQTETQVFDRNHAWFTGFAPYEKPEIAITVFVEKGGGGATMSVPIAKEIINYYFSQPR